MVNILAIINLMRRMPPFKYIDLYLQTKHSACLFKYSKFKYPIIHKESKVNKERIRLLRKGLTEISKGYKLINLVKEMITKEYRR